jgi:TPR repeat protein
MEVKVRKRRAVFHNLVFCLIVLLLPLSVAISACERKSEEAIQRVFDDASAAYEQGDYATAYRLIKPLAEQGYAKAQYNLGVLYNKGVGVPQDYTEAMKWYRKAAEQGLADAQYNLGVMYHEGEGIPQDYAEGLNWFRKAAEQGNADAQYNLGVMYHKGEGVQQDYTETSKWYWMAAEQGHADAQYSLGAMYGRGQGVPQDRVQAYMWLSLAASRFSEPEIEKRQMVILNIGIIASEMTPEQIAEAQRLVREWKPKKERKKKEEKRVAI